MSVEGSTNFLGLWLDSCISFKKHITVLKAQCRESLRKFFEWSLTWMGQRHTLDAVPGHCTLQAELYLPFVWHSMKYNLMDIIHSSGLRMAFGSVLYQPNLQPVHRGLRNSFGRTSVKAIHSLLSENWCLCWQSSTSCPAWIWLNHYRSVCPPAKWDRRQDLNPDPCRWSQSRGSHGLCMD